LDFYYYFGFSCFEIDLLSFLSLFLTYCYFGLFFTAPLGSAFDADLSNGLLFFSFSTFYCYFLDKLLSRGLSTFSGIFYLLTDFWIFLLSFLGYSFTFS
jgi:hypothetical protein